MKSSGQKVVPDAPRAVGAIAGDEACADSGAELLIATGALAGRPN